MVELTMDTVQPVPSIVPIKSWLGSLRPNATSLVPADPALRSLAPSSPTQPRRWMVGGLVAFALTAGVAAWDARPHHARVEPVTTVVSGRAGLRKTSSGNDERWQQQGLTITIDPTLAQAAPAAKDAIVGAFGAWASSGASLPQISFDSTTTPGQAVRDGVNRLLLGPITVAGHEDALALTLSYVDEATGEVVEADTIFNSAYDWATLDPSASDEGDDGQDGCHHRYDLQNVATHEAGHFFGLGEDYDDETTTMYVSSQLCQTSKRELKKSDVTVVSGLYAQAPAKVAQGHACNASIAGGRGSGGAGVAAIALFAVAATRRRRRS
jgi:MYXO-CTERM domain-containing protein